VTDPNAGPKRIVALISGRGSNLQALLDTGPDWLGGAVVAVISNVAAAPGLERARNAGIETRVINHRDFSSREEFDSQLVGVITPLAPDLVVLAGFMRIFSPVFVGAFADRTLNVHPSLLPQLQGLHTHERALSEGFIEHGATVHFMTQDLDGGPPVLQGRVPVQRDDDVDTLAARVLVREHEIYPTAVRWFCHGRLAVQDGLAVLDGDALATPLDIDQYRANGRI
jgi:phosphoribosylglycinamide formyltransferase 1